MIGFEDRAIKMMNEKFQMRGISHIRFAETMYGSIQSIYKPWARLMDVSQSSHEDEILEHMDTYFEQLIDAMLGCQKLETLSASTPLDVTVHQIGDFHFDDMPYKLPPVVYSYLKVDRRGQENCEESYEDEAEEDMIFGVRMTRDSMTVIPNPQYGIELFTYLGESLEDLEHSNETLVAALSQLGDACHTDIPHSAIEGVMDSLVHHEMNTLPAYQASRLGQSDLTPKISSAKDDRKIVNKR